MRSLRIIEIASADNLCHEVGVLKTFKMLVTAFNIIKVIVPVILILISIITLTKSVLSEKDDIKELVGLTIKRIIVGVFIFFIPTLMGTIISYVQTSSRFINISECVNNIENIAYYEQLEKANLEKENLAKANKKAELLTKYNEIMSQYNEDTIFSSKASEGSSGSVIGRKYNLSSADLQFLTKVAKCENGHMDGMKAELSLMANRFELFGSKYSSLRNYVEKSGWFSCARHPDKAKIDESHLSAATSVLVLGNRTLPLYINEHDCINCNKKLCSNGNRGDICKLEINGRTITSMEAIKNHSNYISGQTILYNKYTAVYTFYTFPCERCDPFGYTKSAKNKFDALNKG